MTQAQLLAMIAGVILPLINGLVTKYSAVRTRVFLQVALSAVAGFVAEAIAGGDTFNWNAGIMAWLLALVTALSVEAKVWAPLGISAVMKSAGSSAPSDVNRAA